MNTTKPILFLFLAAGPALLPAQPFTRISGAPFATDLSDASGASWADFDNDGDPDLFVSNRNTGNYLYRNNNDGTLTRISAVPLTSNSSIGNAWADFDNDGDLDVFTAGSSSFLYRNNGNGSFTNITNQAMSLSPAQMPAWACAWADYDLDGLVDLVLTHPAGFVGSNAVPNFLFRNKGDGTFERITDTPVTTGLSSFTVPTWSDYDQDGDPDLFIGSGPADGTQMPDFLYKNLWKETGTAAFERITQAPLGTVNLDGQVWNWADPDNDGDLDVFVTNFFGGVNGGMRDVFFRNNAGVFSAVNNLAPVTDPGLSLASIWADFDNDGDLDLFVANDNNNGAPNRFYHNNGDGTFTRLLVLPFTTDIAPTWGAAAADFDNDGDLDLFVPNIFRPGQSPPNHFYRNDLNNGNHWLKLKLTGVLSNRAAVGAQLYIKAVINGKMTQQYRDVSTQNSFCGHNDLVVHVGLGKATLVDSIRIVWPSGIVQVLTGVAANQTLSVVEDLTTPAPEPAPDRSGGVLLDIFPQPFSEQTTLRIYLPQPARMQLSLLDNQGRLLNAIPAEQRAAGWHEVLLDGSTLPVGAGFVRLQVGQQVLVKPLLRQ